MVNFQYMKPQFILWHMAWRMRSERKRSTKDGSEEKKKGYKLKYQFRSRKVWKFLLFVFVIWPLSHLVIATWIMNYDRRVRHNKLVSLNLKLISSGSQGAEPSPRYEDICEDSKHFLKEKERNIDTTMITEK